MILAITESCRCDIVGLPIEYCKPRISQTEFVVLVKGVHQLYWFVSSSLFSSENKKSESEEILKPPVQVLTATVGFFAQLNSTG